MRRQRALSQKRPAAGGEAHGRASFFVSLLQSIKRITGPNRGRKDIKYHKPDFPVSWRRLIDKLIFGIHVAKT